MKKTIIVLLTLCLVVFAFADEKIYRHGIALDLGGPATLAQVEYEFDFIAKEKHHLGVSLGFGRFIGASTIPVGIQYRWGKTFQLETGAYVCYLWSTVGSTTYIVPKLGFRLNIKKIFLRLYAAPIFSPISSGYQAWAGLGIGLNL
jgi:hypothetical protein